MTKETQIPDDINQALKDVEFHLTILKGWLSSNNYREARIEADYFVNTAQKIADLLGKYSDVVLLKKPKYTDKPRVEKDSDIYYSGYGPDWDFDLDGNLYYKLYSRHHTKTMDETQFSHLWEGAIVNDDERLKRPLRQVLKEMGLSNSKNFAINP